MADAVQRWWMHAASIALGIGVAYVADQWLHGTSHDMALMAAGGLLGLPVQMPGRTSVAAPEEPKP